MSILYSVPLIQPGKCSTNPEITSGKEKKPKKVSHILTYYIIFCSLKQTKRNKT